jgi:hypothetical protein
MKNNRAGMYIHMSALSCLFVATDGCSSSAKKISETLTKNLTENITTSVVNVAKSSGAYIVGKQVLDFSKMRFNCAGGVKIGGISQKMAASINFSQLLSTVDSNSLRQMLTTAVEKTVNSDLSLKTAFAGSAVNTLDQSKTITDNINKIVAGYTYNDFTTDVQSTDLSQNQSYSGTIIESSNPFVPCTIENISQDIAAETLSKSIVKKMLSRAVDNASTMDLRVSESTTQSAVSTGIGEAISGIIGSIGGIFAQNMLLFIVILVVIFAAIAAIVYGVYRVVSG